MAGNFTGASAASIVTEGYQLGSSIVDGEYNAKVLFDDVVPTGVLDLAPYFAAIADPKVVLLIADGDGVNIDLDGAGASAKAFKMWMAEIKSAPSGVLDLEITGVGADQRVRVLVLGDPT